MLLAVYLKIQTGDVYATLLTLFLHKDHFLQLVKTLIDVEMVNVMNYSCLQRSHSRQEAMLTDVNQQSFHSVTRLSTVIKEKQLSRCDNLMMLHNVLHTLRSTAPAKSPRVTRNVIPL